MCFFAAQQNSIRDLTRVKISKMLMAGQWKEIAFTLSEMGEREEHSLQWVLEFDLWM